MRDRSSVIVMTISYCNTRKRFRWRQKSPVEVLKGVLWNRKLIGEVIGKMDEWLGKIRKGYEYIHPESVLRV